jgi:predicted ribosome quality control (RQC) complex YloA/Tae2 family protein
MSFDGMMTRAIVHECQTLIGARIGKIYQPSQTEVTLQLRSQGENRLLLLSAHPVYARMQQVEQAGANPSEPPLFCQVLRKHLQGGRLKHLSQVDQERIIHLEIESKNDWGAFRTLRLILEIMGRHSNLMLIDPESGKILDAIRRIPATVSSYRQILPGLQYQSPPEQGKQNPFTIDRDSFLAGFDYNAGRMDRQIVQRFTGIGPQIAREIVHRAGLGSREQLWVTFQEVLSAIREHQYESNHVIDRDGKEHFSIIPLTYLPGERQIFSSVNDCLTAYYQGKSERDRLRQQTRDLWRKIQNEIAKNRKKIDRLRRESKQNAQAEQYRLQGELLLAHLYQVQKGQSEITLPNYEDLDGGSMRIPLDPALSPNENAQRLFKKYRKHKEAQKWNEEQQQQAALEIAYLESVLLQLEQATTSDLEQIREELQEEGYLKRQQRKKSKQAKPLPIEARASDGTPIWIGRNNKQNDYLTHKLAHKQHIWLHTKDIPGSHVVLRTAEPSDASLREAAMLAAYYSRARESSQVPVDYTQVKHVKKPNGARPGFVIYEQQQTIYITPEEAKIKPLLDKQDKI